MAVDGGIIINMIHKVQLKCINFHVNEQKYILGLYPNLEDYHTGDYFDLLNACFTSIRPQLHSSYINPEEAGRLRQLMRMNYETMHLFGMSRAERARCLTIMNDYYRLHLPFSARKLKHGINSHAVKTLPQFVQ